MAALQRSVTTFRRSGSSGVVWDEMFLTRDHLGPIKGTDEAQEAEFRELRHSKSDVPVGMTGGSGGGGSVREGRRRAEDASAAAIDPPSPRGCLLCGLSGKDSWVAQRVSKPTSRVLMSGGR